MEIAKDFHILKPKDWLRVPQKLIFEKGGKGFLKEYNYSLGTALQACR